eukprot:gene55126-15062_t
MSEVLLGIDEFGNKLGAGHESKGVGILQRLWDAFGGEEKHAASDVDKRGKKYKTLDSHVAIIWGDGVDRESLEKILDLMERHGWSGDNIGFGSGGGLLQKLHEAQCAFKCSYIRKGNDEYVEVFKDPISDHGKKSRKGHLSLHPAGAGIGYTGIRYTIYHTKQTFPPPELTSDMLGNNHVRRAFDVNGDGRIDDMEWRSATEEMTPGIVEGDMLVEVFRNGRILKEYAYTEIIERAKIPGPWGVPGL